MDNDDLNLLISRNLESVISAKGLNPSAWAKSAGMSHTAVRDIILGKVKHPTYKTLVTLAEAAKVDIRWITVGLDFDTIDQEVAEATDLLFQLEPSERQFLIAAAKARIADRGSEPQVLDEDSH